MTGPDLVDYEWQVLRELNGEDLGLSWGAAMGVAVETLQAYGLVTRFPKVVITEKGKALCKENAENFTRSEDV